MTTQSRRRRQFQLYFTLARSARNYYGNFLLCVCSLHHLMSLTPQSSVREFRKGERERSTTTPKLRRHNTAEADTHIVVHTYVSRLRCFRAEEVWGGIAARERETLALKAGEESTVGISRGIPISNLGILHLINCQSRQKRHLTNF